MMSAAPRPVMHGVTNAAIARVILARQIEVHRAAMPLATLGSAFGALLLTAMLRGVVPASLLLLWLGLIGAVLVARLALRAWPPRRADPIAAERAALLLYRLGFLANGTVWSLASLAPLPAGDAMHRSIVIVMLAGVTAVGFMLTAFDLVAALCFGVPVMLMLGWCLATQPDPTYWLLGMGFLGVLGFMGLAALRQQRALRRFEALRLTEARQAEALRNSEELLERTGAIAGVGGWELELATMRLRLTAQAFRIHEVPPVRRPTFEGFVSLYPPAQQADIRAGLELTIAAGQPYDRELPMVTATGRHRWVRLVGRPRSQDGSVVRVEGVLQDITDAKLAQRALADQQQLLMLLVRHTSEGFWFADRDGFTTDANPAMCRILGRPRDELIGRHIFEFVSGPNEAIMRSEVARREQGFVGNYEIALTRPDGTQIDCFNSATPIFGGDGERLGSIGMYTEIGDRKRAEDELRATTEALAQKTDALQLTLDSIEQGIIGINPAGHTQVHNRRALELLDLPPELMTAETHHTEVAKFQIARGDLGPDGGFEDDEGRYRSPATEPVWPLEQYVRRGRHGLMIEVRTRMLASGGRVRTYTDVTTHVESQRALRDNEAALRALLDAFPGFIAVLDSDFHYTYANERFAALVGRRREQVIGRTAAEVLGPAAFERLSGVVAQLRSGDQLTTESEYPAAADRTHTWLQVTHAIGADSAGGRHKMYAFGIDISARKIAEGALIAARDEAERANAAKSQFLSSMSHELRTPMNAILGFGQLLAADPEHPLAARPSGYVREILRGGRHLLSLINEVLDLALVEAGKLRISIEPVRVSELLQECLDLLHPLAETADIAISMIEPASCNHLVNADRTRLKQVLLNLISNAIKYNRPGGRVAIDCVHTDDGLVRISVADTGPGLDDAQRARLFQAFERLDAGDGAVEGAGLGLALSKRLMEAMGGSIGLASEVGRGSEFWVSLPQASAPAFGLGVPLPRTLAVRDSTLLGAAQQVLYIEDNPVNTMLMEAMLARVDNLRMLAAALPEVGLRMAQEQAPDLILLDIQLPGMDGYEVLRRLQANPATRAIPVIAVSANAMSSDVERGLAAGFVAYLAKPLDMQLLTTVVEATLAGETPD